MTSYRFSGCKLYTIEWFSTVSYRRQSWPSCFSFNFFMRIFDVSLISLMNTPFSIYSSLVMSSSISFTVNPLQSALTHWNFYSSTESLPGYLFSSSKCQIAFCSYSNQTNFVSTIVKSKLCLFMSVLEFSILFLRTNTDSVVFKFISFLKSDFLCKPVF